MRRDNRRIALALSIIMAGAAFAGPAAAQLAGGRSAFDGRERAIPVQFRDFFRPFWGGGGGYYRNNSYDPYNPFSQRQPQAYESLKPPAPRKVETPPTETILVIGDSLADWLGYGLEEAFADTPQVGIVRKIRPYSGLVRYEARADAPDWSQAVKDVLAPEKPAAIVVMLGLNDRLPLRERAPAAKSTASSPGQGALTAPAAETPPDADQPPAANEAQRRPPPGGNYEFHTDKWAELYEKRIDEMIAALKSKGVPVLWVGLPAVRGTKSTSDMLYLDELYRARAEKAGIDYIDIWDGFVDEQGRYTQQGPDFQGQTRRLRTYDGVNFTKYGAEKLAHYVEHELRPVLNSRVLPVALPGPEEQSPGKGGADAKPAIGPVVPLSAIGRGDGGELLGASRPAQKEADPLATRVLSRGDALAAPPGRADDFSWPRSDLSTDGASDGAPGAAPPAPGPAAAPKGAGKTETNKTETNKTETNKSDANKTDGNKSELKKADAKKEPAAAAAAPPKPRPQRLELDGAPPRPPLPVGPAAAR
jgi:uncharacterized protein